MSEALPFSCTTGDIFIAKSGVSYACLATNDWSVVADSVRPVVAGHDMADLIFAAFIGAALAGMLILVILTICGYPWRKA